MGDLHVKLPGYHPPSAIHTDVYYREAGTQEWKRLGVVGEDGLLVPVRRASLWRRLWGRLEKLLPR